MLLVADLPGDLDRLLVAGALGHTGEQLVAGELEVLVGDRVGDQLARRVGLGAREEDKALAAGGHDRVLELGRRGTVRLQAVADQPFLLLGLAEMVGEETGQLRVAGDLGRGAELGERLLLDRMRVRHVLDQLLTHARHRNSFDRSCAIGVTRLAPCTLSQSIEGGEACGDG